MTVVLLDELTIKTEVVDSFPRNVDIIANLAFITYFVKFELKMEGVTVFATPNALSLHHETIHGDYIFKESAESFGNIKYFPYLCNLIENEFDMNDDRYLRSIKDLEKVGSKWWPKEVRDEAMKVSILQYLLDTQEKFISLLILADREKPEKLFSLIDASDFEYHLFLKHLILLTDVGSEPIQRFNASFKEIFPDGQIEYAIGKKKHSYKFVTLPTKGVPNNKKMQSDTLENLEAPCRNIELCKDLIILLIYGAASTTARTAAVLYKCNAFEYLGQDELVIRDGIKKNSYRKFWHDDAMDERWQISQWMLRSTFGLS